MNQDIAPSPCINVCIMDKATGWCTGCFRTLDEIVAWGNAPSASKWAVLHELEAREATYFKGAA
jgi:predicted Fe-S protein YdhL (DUF1289 family)